jgi:2-oxoglutarate dehydrogenase E1 component
MDDLIQQGGQKSVEECVIGMAHRGRLNVLVNLLGKSPSVLFNEFEGKYDTAHLQGSGDVKYHKGFSSTCARRAATYTWRWRSIRRISKW